MILKRELVDDFLEALEAVHNSFFDAEVEASLREALIMLLLYALKGAED